jgi:hypothetical protein
MGTSIVQLARKQPLKLYPYEANGNPHDSITGHHLEIWNYSPSKLAAFLQYCREQNVEMICTEYGLPPINYIPDDIILFTVIRNPFDRLISNYLYDKREGHTKLTLEEYYTNVGPDYTSANFYLYSLSSGSNKLEDAQAMLDRCEYVLIQEQPSTFTQLSKLGLTGTLPHVNATKANSDPKILYPDFYARFKSENEEDYKIYSYALLVALADAYE